MKWLAYIMLIFCFGTSSGQEVPSNGQELTNAVLEEFIQLGLDNGFYARYHIENNLASIEFMSPLEFRKLPPQDPNKDGSVGLRVNYNLNVYQRRMLVNSKYRDNKAVARIIIFHELGHFFGLEHDNTEPGIMNKELLEEYAPTAEEIETLFRKIKNVPPNKYMLPIKLLTQNSPTK
jgi:hypothetical protein